MITMNSVFEIGFFMGLIGSLHCIGMCGPLVMALPIANQSYFQKWQSILLYNAGKISSYTILGIVLGLFGSQLPLHGVQENLSIVMGCIMLLYVIYVFIIKAKWTTQFLHFNFLYKWIIKKMSGLFKSKKKTVFFIIGFLNGLLPCGMIYVALTSAIATQNLIQGGFIMAFFGLGTMPALIMVAIGGQYFGVVFRRKIQNLLPVFIFSMGVLLILRGMNLGIPYLSPSLGVGVDKISCHN
jgi:sulfite exporter TauE/SafE